MLINLLYSYQHTTDVALDHDTGSPKHIYPAGTIHPDVLLCMLNVHYVVVCYRPRQLPLPTAASAGNHGNGIIIKSLKLIVVDDGLRIEE